MNNEVLIDATPRRNRHGTPSRHLTLQKAYNKKHTITIDQAQECQASGNESETSEHPPFADAEGAVGELIVYWLLPIKLVLILQLPYEWIVTSITEHRSNSDVSFAIILSVGFIFHGIHTWLIIAGTKPQRLYHLKSAIHKQTIAQRRKQSLKLSSKKHYEKLRSGEVKKNTKKHKKTLKRHQSPVVTGNTSNGLAPHHASTSDMDDVQVIENTDINLSSSSIENVKNEVLFLILIVAKHSIFNRMLA